MRTCRMSLASNSNSTHDPRYGMIRAEKIFLPEASVLPRSSSKNTPAERWSWLTTTRSVPLMMKVPFSVMSGSSPR